MSSRAAALITIAVLAAGCTDAPAPEVPAPAQPDAALMAELTTLAAAPVMVVETDMGTFRALLYTDRMPITAGRIAELASSGFYDGVLIHRVVDDFVIQGGDPTGTGEGGSGEMIPFETHPDLPFGIGALGMAQWTPGSADSQWFVTEKPAPHLNEGTDDPVASRLGPYPMFGEVVAGMDVVRAITEVETIPGWDRPVEEIRVTTARVETAAGLDLLALPHILEPNFQLAGGTFHLEQPLHLYATHRFVVQVTVATPPTETQTIELVFRQDGVANVPVLLEPIDDGTVFEGRVMLTAGPWEETLRVGEAEASWDRTVLPWSPEYGAFALVV